MTANAALCKLFINLRDSGLVMTIEILSRRPTRAELEQRVIRYVELRPCRNAFIDTRTPGSEEKENFTIIGPGVSENPEQFVHMEEPHGYNIGGARQPPSCINSQHSHDTAEVFVVHSGKWRFDFGEHGADARVEAGPGDVVSFPTRAFRGFTNIGDGPGFLWSVLGGDDPGRVTWAPSVFEMAKDYGLVLMENGSLIDTAAGQRLPAGAKPMRATSTADVAALRRLEPADAERAIARDAESRKVGGTIVIGPGGLLDPTDGFTLRRDDLLVGHAIDQAPSDRQEVIFVHRGALDIAAADGEVRLGEGDTLSLPAGVARCYRATEPTTLFRVIAS